MTSWIAVPQCPNCTEIMRKAEDYDDFWQCVGCGFMATSGDLAYLGNEFEDEDDDEE